MVSVFAHGTLRLYLLALLEEGPKHGYDIIKALSDRFGGSYSPSAGTIYPRLAKLQEEGLVETASDGRRTIYSITAAGLAEIGQRREEIAQVEDNISASVRRLADDIRSEVRENMRGLRANLAASAEAAKAAAKATSTRTAREDAHSAAKQDALTLKKAEANVKVFAAELQAELRVSAAQSPLETVTIEAIDTVLQQAKLAIGELLR